MPGGANHYHAGMDFLLDGYNVLHAAGFVPAQKLAPGRLNLARERMLNWLADQPKLRPVLVRVVFDAVRGREPSLEQLHRGVRTQFAYRETADDFIERMLDVHPKPETITIVSNDRRVRTAATTVGGAAWDVAAFLDWLNAPDEVGTATTGSHEKRELPQSLNDELLKAFDVGGADQPLDDAPELAPQVRKADGTGGLRPPLARAVKRIDTDLDLLAIFTSGPKTS